MKTNIINTPNMSKAKVRNNEATFFMSGATQDNKEITNLLNNKKYYIHTYGCQANVRDEETGKTHYRYMRHPLTWDNGGIPLELPVLGTRSSSRR